MARARVTDGYIPEAVALVQVARQLGVAEGEVSAIIAPFVEPALELARRALATGNISAADSPLTQAELLGADPAVTKPMREQILLVRRRMAASQMRRHR